MRVAGIRKKYGKFRVDSPARYPVCLRYQSELDFWNLGCVCAWFRLALNTHSVKAGFGILFLHIPSSIPHNCSCIWEHCMMFEKCSCLFNLKCKLLFAVSVFSLWNGVPCRIRKTGRKFPVLRSLSFPSLPLREHQLIILNHWLAMCLINELTYHRCITIVSCTI